MLGAGLRRVRDLAGPVAIAAAGALVLMASLGSLGWWTALETASSDARMRFWRYDRATPDSLVTVLVDDVSLDLLEPRYGRWPWSRGAHADLVDALRAAGVAGVYYDVLFAEGADAEGDRRFGAALQALGKGTLALVLRGDGPSPSALPEGAATRGIAIEGVRPGSYTAVDVPVPDVLAGTRRLGSINVVPDDDGAVRRVAPVHEYQGTVFPALGLAAALDALNPPVLSLRDGVLRVGDTRLRLAEDGRQRVLLHGRYLTVRFVDVLAGAGIIPADRPGLQPVTANQLRGKLVFVGPSAAGLGDLKVTPMQAAQPGVFVHVSTAANVIAGESLRVMGGRTAWFVAGLLALAVAATVILLPRPWGAAGLLLPLGYFALGWMRYAQGAEWALTLPGLSGVAAGLTALLFHYWFPPATGRASAAGHWRREALAVVKADYALGCADDPEAQAAFAAGRGTGAMDWEKPVREHQGRIVRSDAEGLLAVWVGPEAARRAHKAAEELNLGLARALMARGRPGGQRPPLGVGLAAAQGLIRLLPGHGAEVATLAVFEANALARLSGRLGCGVVMDDSVRKALGAAVKLAPFDRVTWCVWGMPTTIYHQPGGAGDAVGRWVRAFDAYTRGKFEEALQLADELPAGRVRRRFEARCRRLQGAVPSGWDGAILWEADDDLPADRKED